MDTPILESVPDDQVKGIDVLRAIRSFIVTGEINSCGCTLDERVTQVAGDTLL